MDVELLRNFFISLGKEGRKGGREEERKSHCSIERILKYLLSAHIVI